MHVTGVARQIHYFGCQPLLDRGRSLRDVHGWLMLHMLEAHDMFIVQ